jgi:hypothetical protein
MALDINPTDTEVKQQYETLDKIVNHKNYKYSINDEKTIELMKSFVDCCNVKEFERLYKIISDDFVCVLAVISAGQKKRLLTAFILNVKV